MSITVELLNPLPGAARVPVDASLTVHLRAVGEVFNSVQIKVNGLLVYRYTDHYEFAYPDAAGTVQISDADQNITLMMRRNFLSLSKVTVSVSAATDLSAETTQTFEFFTADLRSYTPQIGRVDSSFPTPALELFRQAAIGAVGQRRDNAGPHLVHRVKSTKLASLLPRVDNYTGLLSLAPVSTLADAADQLSFMLRLAEEELTSLGVSKEVIETVSNTFSSSYPQERAGALALLVLLACDKLT